MTTPPAARLPLGPLDDARGALAAGLTYAEASFRRLLPQLPAQHRDEVREGWERLLDEGRALTLRLEELSDASVAFGEGP